MTALQRRYIRLLRAYPPGYPREELLGTLLAAAPPDRSRPPAREAANLIRHGLRARLGRPASRTVVFWALAATVIGALFGAAFAVRAGWETTPPLPGPERTRAMSMEILPDLAWTDASAPPPAQFIIYGQPLDWSMARDLLLGDGGEYSQAAVGAWVPGGPHAERDKAVADAQANLEAKGWAVYPVRYSDAYSCGGPPCDPASIPRDATLAARRGGLFVTVEVFAESTADTTFVAASFQRTTPAAVWPCGIAGGLLAGLAAFALFAWASRRTDGERHRARGAVKKFFGTGLLLWWAPTLFALPLMVLHHIQEPHPSWHPMWEWFGQPTFSLFFVAGGGCILLALALAALPRRRPEAFPVPA
ncbi:hypothetical protein [Dactylosporangium sp. CA-233914]|uniref:hypothetical protein n=1 Tax=Dactylosporangium sp. CA-233914 TaxID=3239934 RepID=UPI003D908E72